MNENESTDGEETCPICGRRNNPGCDDTCQHFIGAVWDGDLIWGQFDGGGSNKFHEALAAVQEHWDAVSETNAKNRQRLKVFCKAAALDSTLLEKAASAAEILEAMSVFSRGDPVETDGMLSGSGYTLYHTDPQIVTKLTDQLWNLNAQMRSTVPA